MAVPKEMMALKDMKELLFENEDTILKTLNDRNSGFAQFLKRQKYEVKDIDLAMRLIVKASCSRNLGAIEKLLKLIMNHGTFLSDSERSIELVCSGDHSIKPARLIQNYAVILKHILKKFFIERVDKDEYMYVLPLVQKNLPILQNAINSLESSSVNVIEAKKEVTIIEKACENYENCIAQNGDKPLEDFRSLSIFPQSEEITRDCGTFIRPNKIEGCYVDVEDYLDLQYRLFREDMVRTFRKFIEKCKKEKDSNLVDGFYTDLRVSYPPKYTVNGVLHKIAVRLKKSVDWGASRCLVPGSLVCLTSDNFATLLMATVKDRSPDKGVQKHCDISVVIEERSVHVSAERKYIMIETTAYFEAYRHVLTVLKNFNSRNFPFADFIAHLDYENFVPEHLENAEICLQEQCSIDQNTSEELAPPCEKFRALDLESWPSAELMKLDVHQIRAFQLSLTHKVALIQGPPGTGKTFLGVKIVKALLHNLPEKPIVICCVTNHALDQFLHHLLKFTNSVLRIGGQSQSEALAPHVLYNMVTAVRQFREQGEHSFGASDMLKDALKNAKALVPNIINMQPSPMDNDDYFDLKRKGTELDGALKSLVLCISDYMCDTALNMILPLSFKQELCKNEGTSESVLSRNMKQWLAFKANDSCYEICKKMWKRYADNEQKERNKSDGRKDSLLKVLKDIWTVPLEKRYELFYHWRQGCIECLGKEMKEMQPEYFELLQKSEKPMNFDRVTLTKAAGIIGITMTGAAKNYALLSSAKPTIMVVEEAAEALEPHLIASIVPSVKQLILIGDHEQLRPIPADHELSVDYNLSISMFERLYKNEAPSATLVTQHRMRPCIAELLVPEIYSSLSSHESVSQYEHTRGVLHDLFFFKHHEREERVGVSCSNKFEAQFVVHLVLYFLAQGYEHSQITVLAMYAEQVTVIQKWYTELSQDRTRLNVSSVDGYQGEENDIILISFVRSNAEGSIGFLRETNRLCVALSRARKGLFCIGDFDMLVESSHLWLSVVKKLVKTGSVGDEFPLQCSMHETVVPVKSVEQIDCFLAKGCQQVCGYELLCGHYCRKLCHSKDLEHVFYKCSEPCEKVIETRKGSMPCKRKCGEPCKTAKEKLLLPCGHEEHFPVGSGIPLGHRCQIKMKKFLACRHLVEIPCYLKPEDYNCEASIHVVLNCGHADFLPCSRSKQLQDVFCAQSFPRLSPCGHTVEVPCYVNPEEDNLLAYCTNPCDALLDCGHACTGSCHSCSSLKIHEKCPVLCGLKLRCGHICSSACGVPCFSCKQICSLRCPHKKCTNPCSKPCVDCKTQCSRRCEHQTCNLPCYMICEVLPCKVKCTQLLECKHMCVGLCGDPCPSLCRICDSDHFKDDCPDDVFIELEDCNHVFEARKLTAVIEESFTFEEWPVCPECSTAITRSQRFSDQLKRLKRKLLEIADVADEMDEICYLFHTLFGMGKQPSWRFQNVHDKIRLNLENSIPSSASTKILKKCIMCLKVLISLVQDTTVAQNKADRIDVYISWIYNNFERASFQQLRELECAVNSL